MPLQKFYIIKCVGPRPEDHLLPNGALLYYDKNSDNYQYYDHRRKLIDSLQCITVRSLVEDAWSSYVLIPVETTLIQY